MSNIVMKRGVTVKKTVFWTVFTAVLLTLCISAGAAQIYYNDAYHDYSAEEITLEVNGKVLSQLPMSPVIIDDYTMVPVREVFEALGSDVIWHDDTCQVEIADNGVSVFVKIGDRNTIVSGQVVPIDIEQPLPMLIGHNPDTLKSMVPVRFVAEKLKYKVDWDNKTRTVSIYDEDFSEIMGDVTEEEIVMPEAQGSFGTVQAESDGTYDYVYISTRYGISPKITRYTDPQRVVFDFPGATFVNNGGALPLNGNIVKNVRYSNNNGMARLVMDVEGSTQVMVMSSERGIMLRAQKSKNEAIVYDAFSSRVYFDKNYAGNGKSVDNGYSVTFTNFKLENQKIEIHDKNIYEIIISNSSAGCTVTVDGSKKLTYTAEKGFFKSDKPVVEQQKPNPSGKKLVVIDAGHGGHDPGAVGYNSSGKAVAYESHINLAIALLVGEKLEKSGVEVIYTRDKDEYITLTGRSEIANNSECDMFVSIHCNSIENPSIKGTQVYYHPSSETGTQLAQNIYDNVVKLTGLSPKETQNGSHLYVIRTTASPAVLVETAFISNESDRNYLLSKSGQEALAEGIYRGIIETLN
ncbi:MAG: AMIN domain-containing protein [Ruminococcaceae bacterium]|nr:AMIN domain-containing protein [Oscillospiraceae bacterium]